MSESTTSDVRIARAIRVVAASADSASGPVRIRPLLGAISERGYLTPDEDDLVRLRYSQYLHRRAALLEALRSVEPLAVREGDPVRLPALAVALAAAVLLLEDARAWVALATACRPLRKKLDEGDSRYGLPRKTFAAIYRAGTDPVQLRRLHHAHLAFGGLRRDAPDPLSDPALAPVLAVLDSRDASPVPPGGAKWRERLSYRWFSFRRRHHSFWKRTVFRVFEGSGCLVAELRQPGTGFRPLPKRVTFDFRDSLLRLARPGDVFITRHDDALSNLFLPGHWPHGALYFGTEEQRGGIGLKLAPHLARQAADPAVFLESKKDGVRFRPASETLAVDALVILRPPFSAEETAAALERAAGHAGKLYDFVFDFRNSDRLVCTEVVYRGFHGLGGLDFQLIESGGRLCLPAEQLIHQALEQGFRVVATCGIGGGGVLRGQAAELALHRSRCGL